MQICEQLPQVCTVVDKIQDVARQVGRAHAQIADAFVQAATTAAASAARPGPTPAPPQPAVRAALINYTPHRDGGATVYLNRGQKHGLNRGSPVQFELYGSTFTAPADRVFPTRSRVVLSREQVARAHYERVASLPRGADWSEQQTRTAVGRINTLSHRVLEERSTDRLVGDLDVLVDEVRTWADAGERALPKEVGGALARLLRAASLRRSEPGEWDRGSELWKRANGAFMIAKFDYNEGVR
jgi:hypothetical protein